VPGAEGGVTESGLPSFGLPSSVAGVAGSAAAAAARPYGRILIFTLLDDRVADFDRLAEESAEYVRTGEPDTLVYVIHLVPNAPLQRIFYEIYRDRAAFDSHESQPYMQRFVAERRTCVLATNVIELQLKYAKVAPLPGPPLPGPPQRARSLPPSRPQRPNPQRPGQPGYGQPGYGQPGYGEPRADRERYDERRPDPRQVPSGRPYGG
jgi:quinol monooxygenase YgiN